MFYTRILDKHSERDLQFLLVMLYESIHIPENKPAKEKLLNSPSIKKYSDGWGRQGDRAVIALSEDNMLVGAAWYRLFTENQKGYGYVDSNTPEIGIAVKDDVRGNGIGTLLLKKLFETALEDGYTSLSLSVDPNNTEAVQLYRKLGFKQCGTSGTSWTMVCHIPQSL
ncbi:GNAT family N-acetyltransferase [Evansella halocellulosilytica]|uniref:GNAT family N-acetyltransferase n=1 Tax=Evansella halocellulosilytica TaxID=2011013 RepID=UPI000BB9691B|nr:GNAT family N-acetyltransferase [Evansella halocellulosilytica]